MVNRLDHEYEASTLEVISDYFTSPIKYSDDSLDHHYKCFSPTIDL